MIFRESIASFNIFFVTGNSASRLPAPNANKHRVSPSAQNADNKTNNSAWMFGQHKNARVVCQNVRTLD